MGKKCSPLNARRAGLRMSLRRTPRRSPRSMICMVSAPSDSTSGVRAARVRLQRGLAHRLAGERHGGAGQHVDADPPPVQHEATGERGRRVRGQHDVVARVGPEAIGARLEPEQAGDRQPAAVGGQPALARAPPALHLATIADVDRGADRLRRGVVVEPAGPARPARDDRARTALALPRALARIARRRAHALPLRAHLRGVDAHAHHRGAALTGRGQLGAPRRRVRRAGTRRPAAWRAKRMRPSSPASIVQRRWSRQAQPSKRARKVG